MVSFLARFLSKVGTLKSVLIKLLDLIAFQNKKNCLPRVGNHVQMVIQTQSCHVKVAF